MSIATFIKARVDSHLRGFCFMMMSHGTHDFKHKINDVVLVVPEGGEEKGRDEPGDGEVVVAEGVDADPGKRLQKHLLHNLEDALGRRVVLLHRGQVAARQVLGGGHVTERF